MMKKELAFIWMSLWLITPMWAQFQTGTGSAEAMEAYEAGLEALAEGKPATAAAFFEDASEADERFVDAYLGLGRSFLILGELENAIKSFDEAVTLYPRSLEGLQQLAIAYQIQGNYEMAISSYKQMLFHYPDYPKAYDGLARAFYANKNYNAAIISAEQAMGLYLQNDANKEAANVRLIAAQGSIEIGDFEKAIKYIKACKKQMDGSPAYYYHLGYCFYKMGKKDKALEHLQTAEEMGYRVPNYLKNNLENWE